MTANPNLPTPTDEREKKVLDDVAEHGWHVVLVKPEGDSPGWGFTVGLHHNFEHPEVILFGLPAELIHSVLNEVGDRIKNGQVMQPETRHDGLLEGVRCEFRLVHDRWLDPFMGWGLWFYQRARFPVVQVLWPDKEHNFPWEKQFRDDWRWAQPLLFKVDAEGANAEELLATMR